MDEIDFTQEPDEGIMEQKRPEQSSKQEELILESKRFIEETIFGLGIGLAGMVSLLCIIYAAFTMQSSQGNPEKIKKAQELLTSCIMGLILIIFSVFILRLIGVSILRIPGFS